jgi:hypothetical protein
MSVDAGMDPYEAEQMRRTQNIIALVSSLFKTYGLESLAPKIIQYAQDGYEADAIGLMLRDTPEYKARFPAMASLMAKKRAITEAEYIDYEKQAAQLEIRYGLPKGMVSNTVTTLLENEVSAAELQDRVTMASDAVLQAPQALRDTFRRYYGVDSGALTGYFLDPKVAAPILQKQYVASQIGMEAMAQNVDVQSGVAEQLQSLGVTQESARQGFSNISRQMEFTAGKGETTTQEDLIGGNLLNQQKQIQDIERISQSRTGRFQAGGNFVGEASGLKGLGSSSNS